MKLLVFAHVPPPHHGQSYMVQLMLEGLAKRGEKVVHIDCRVSDGLDDIGSVRTGKLGRLLRFCWQALVARWRTGAEVFYYIPAPGKRSALYRDWVVMAICRPFFPRLVLHWHAVGLSEWLEREGKGYERWISKALLGRPTVSLVLAQASQGDAEWLSSRRMETVPNGIPDPCPQFASEVLPKRLARLEARRRALADGAKPEEPFRLLYLAHCTREKGLFDAVEGVALYLERGAVIPVHLKVAGEFPDEGERQEFEALVKVRGLENVVEYVGFAGADEKARLLTEADALCFPTYYHAESFGLVVVEAMAFGCLPLVSRWRAIPELLPEGYPAFVNERAPEEVAAMIGQMLTLNLAAEVREEFEARFTLERHLDRLAAVLREA